MQSGERVYPISVRDRREVVEEEEREDRSLMELEIFIDVGH